MGDQITMPGCEPVAHPEPTAEERAAIERVERACKAELERRKQEFRRKLDQGIWRMDVERSQRRRAMTPEQRAADDRREAAEAAQDEADCARNEADEAAWKAATPAQRRAIRDLERLESATHEEAQR